MHDHPLRHSSFGTDIAAIKSSVDFVLPRRVKFASLLVHLGIGSVLANLVWKLDFKRRLHWADFFW